MTVRNEASEKRKKNEKESKKILTNGRKWGIIVRQVRKSADLRGYLFGEVLKLAEEAPLLRV